MFELILKWPTVSHTVQTVSQRLRRLLRHLLMRRIGALAYPAVR